ncbi:hypothetical protein JFU47_27670 [Pseudomonas sp. TH39(2020)]|uniref:fascin domain-containing protein n=1 Tax=Pseudomonas sp. TH39(2020) TaxID=2796349 RepID=UPI001914D146|nr:hypothetical protein [Pseudomonas sp. TH39(2020)]MBK5400452.1 hypothetical protein [Pseudomonas sp. TH39(2020)]
MEIETKNNVPAGFPYGGKVFAFANLAEGKFITATSNRQLIASAQSIDKFCHFQFVALPTNEVKIFSIGHQSFVSAIGSEWPLFARVEDETWSRFIVEYNASIGAFTIKSTQALAASSSYVSVADAGKRVRICEATPREKWSYFQPYIPNGVPATNIGQFMP